MDLDEILKIGEENCNKTKEEDERNSSGKFSGRSSFSEIERTRIIASFFSGDCPTIWDGIRCWPRSNAGEIVSSSCPDYIKGFDSTVGNRNSINKSSF